MKLSEKIENMFLTGGLDGAVNFLNNLGWNLSWRKNQDLRITLYGGDQVIGWFDTAAEMEALIFGMVLGLAVLPVDIMQQIENMVEKD